MRLIVLFVFVTLALVSAIELTARQGDAYLRSWNSEPVLKRQETRNGPLYYHK